MSNNQIKDDLIVHLGSREPSVDARLQAWEQAGFSKLLWSKDHRLWTEEPQPEIEDRLGWLTLPEAMQDSLDDYVAFADEVRADGHTHVVLLGMGGSSLAPEVFQRTLGSGPGYPELITLDSTHPEAVEAVRRRTLHGQKYIVCLELPAV